MKWLMCIFAASLGCTSYNVKIKQPGTMAPVLTCKKAVQMDEAGVCYDFYGCSDGADHLHCDWTLVK
jgi:hypothetical protein